MAWPFSSPAEPVERRDIPISLDAERKYAPVDDGRASLVFAGSARWGTRSPEAFAREGYVRNVVGFACIRLIAQNAASVELQLEQGSAAKIIDSHPMLDLLERPSQMLSGTEFMEALIALRLIYGNAYVTWLLAGKKPKELWLLPPQKMTIETGRTPDGITLPTAYVLNKGGSGEKTYRIDPLTGACDVAHLKSFNPVTLTSGLSPMEPAAFSIDTHTATLGWNKALLDNGGRPSGALVMTGSDGQSATLSDEQYARLKAQMDANIRGAANAGKPLLLDGGLDWKQMGMSPTDMDFEKGLWAAAIQICMAFGVPPQMLGIPGQQTFANFEQATNQLWNGAVLPALRSALTTLNSWLAPAFGDPTLRLQPDDDTIAALEPQRQIRYDRARLADYLTVDEKRALAGYGPLPNKLGEQVLVNSAQTSLADLGLDLTLPAMPTGDAGA